MGNISKYAAINAKAKAMESQLLTNDDFEKLVELPDFESVADYLKQETAYGDLMGAEAILDVEALEGLLKKHLFNQYERLFHYFSGDDKKLFKILFMRSEIENLKVFLRMIIRKEGLARISDHIIIPKAYSSIDYTLLNDARNIDDFINGLEGTDYQKIIQMFKDEEEDKLMFYLEMNLDRLYFKKLYSQVKKLDGENRRAIGEVVGRTIDMLNIQWIYRGRRFYHITQEELINYSLPGGKYFKYEQLKDMCYKEKLSDIEGLIRQSAYGSLFEDVPDFVIFLERSMERYVYRYFRSLRLSYPMTLVEPLVYMHSLEYEIRDLITILETKRYQLKAEECKKYLVRHMA